MIHFLLDTNILSEFSRIGEPNPNVSLWLKAANDEQLFTSVLTFAEIRRGMIGGQTHSMLRFTQSLALYL